MKRNPVGPRQADPPLLGYAVTSAPDPIQVSTASAPATAVISASVAPLGGQPVYCNQITIYVYVGTDEQALSADQPASGVNRGSWAPSESGIKSAEALGLPGTADDLYAYFTYGCSVPADFDIDYLLIFTLQATVNTVPGPFTLNFEETSAMTSDPSSFTPRDTAVPMTKADSVFYLDNFIATVAGTPAVPASEFANGAANQIVFSWASNGTGYTLFAGMPATQIYTGQATTFTLPAGASVDTTYTLQAEQVSGGAPAEYLYRTLTLTVANPDLTPNSVVAAGAVSAASLAATGNATIGGTAGVTGALTASGGANVRGGLSTDTLNASGAISAGSAGISGAISANSLSVNGATVNQLNAGGANISGGLAAGSITSGWTSLAPAPDYSQGCVGIGGTSYNNYLVTVTNMQNYGMGVFINAPNLSDSWWALDVHGQCINSSGSWSQISDERLKENIQPFSDGLAKVLRIDPVRYRYKADTGIGPDKEYVSVLAQSLKKTAPYMVGKSRLKPDSRKEYLCIDSGPLTYMLINAVKELHAEIEGLKRSKGKSAKG